MPGADSSVDSGGRDGGPAGALCDAPRAVTLTMGDQTLTGDTTGASTDFTLADGCGSPDATAPTEVFALTLPGTGLKGVTFNLGNDATTWDTLVEIRPDGCAAATNTSCFDDILAFLGIVQSAGSFTAEGGSTVYLVLTGFPGSMDGESGAYELELSVSDATAPTFTSGNAYRVGTERYDLVLQGTDPEGDAAYARVSFLDATDAPIGVDTDEDPSTPDETVFELNFDRVSGRPDFEALLRIDDTLLFAGTAAATKVDVTILDEFSLESASMQLTIVDVTEAGLGGTCGATIICADGFDCVGTVCAIPAAVATACSAATAVTVTPGASTTSQTVSGSLDAGDSLMFAMCGDTSGAENLYTVVVPGTGTFDLIASTDNATTGDADTVVHIRSTCGDPGTEVACNDDGGDAYRSIAVVEAAAAGTYTIAVEIYGGAEMATPYDLVVSLRPVLAAGMACDPTEEMNRCSTDTCPMTGTAVCPPAP